MHLGKDWFTIQRYTMCCVAPWITFMLTLVETQRDARIDSDPILVFLCVAFLRQVSAKIFNYKILCFENYNAMQDLASLCELALNVSNIKNPKFIVAIGSIYKWFNIQA